jgi:hypothetical protein
MGFKANRLRIQLPCQGSESVVQADEIEPLTTPPCNAGWGTAPPCHYLSCLDLPCHMRFGTPCIDASGPPPPPTGCQGFSPCGFFATPPACTGFSRPHCDWPSAPGCWGGGATQPPGCVGGFETCGFVPSDCGDGTCTQGTGCLFGSITIKVKADEEDTLLLHPDQLPAIKQHLERKLEEIEQLEAFKPEIEKRLEDLGRAERELKRRRDEE